MVRLLRQRLGNRWLGQELNRRRGDADVLGLVRGPGGWEAIPCDIVVDGDEQFFVPQDDSEKAYPADGVPSDPPRLFGCPVAIGYKNFGALSQVPNIKVARDVIVNADEIRREQSAQQYNAEIDVMEIHREDVIERNGMFELRPAIRDEVETRRAELEEDDDDIEWDELERDEQARYVLKQAAEAASSALESGGGTVQTGLQTAASRLTSWWQSVRWSRGWAWTQGKADALVLEEDADAAVVMERAEYRAGADEPEWFVAEGSGYYFDARGAGGEPSTVDDAATLGIAFSSIPKLLAPVSCRIARNIHETRVELDGVHEYGGSQTTTDGAVPDGGMITESMPDPKTAQPDQGAIEVEERAFVDPEDVKLLGGAQETQDKIETLIKQIEAKANTPGGEMRDRVLRYGMVFIAFILGSQLSGGGGGGGSITGSLPLAAIPDPGMLQSLIGVVPVA